MEETGCEIICGAPNDPRGLRIDDDEQWAGGPVLWTYMGRKTPPPSTSLSVMDEIVGVNTASLGGYLYSSKTRARWAEGFHDELNGHVFDLERDGLRQVVLCPRPPMR